MMRLMASASSSTSSRKIGGKESAGHDVQREMHHVDGDVSLLAVTPTVAQSDGFPHHGIGVFRNALAMKRRLRHLPLQAVLCAFAGDHAFAQQHLCALDRALLDEVVVLHDQNFADVVGMIQENNVMPSDLVVGDIAVFFGQVLKQEDRIGRTKLAERKPEQISLESGRKAVLPRWRLVHIVADCVAILLV